MAPERFGTGEADPRSDVYALACVLHQCLTGQRPFPGDSVEQQVAGHLTSPPPRPSAVAADVPIEFDDVIANGMAKNPDERYATTKDLAAAARAALTVTAADPLPTKLQRPLMSAVQRATESEPSTELAQGRPPLPGTSQPPAVGPFDPTQMAPYVPSSPIPRTRKRTAVIVPVVLAVLLASATMFAVLTAPHIDHTVTATPQWQPYVDAGKRMAQDLTTIDYQTVDADVNRILDNATGQFLTDFKQRAEPFTESVRNVKSTAKGTVTGGGLESLDVKSAKVLVSITVNTTLIDKPPEDPKAWRMRLQVVRTGDDTRRQPWSSCRDTYNPTSAVVGAYHRPGGIRCGSDDLRCGQVGHKRATQDESGGFAAITAGGSRRRYI
jgi:serine/threonine-protein kinase